MIGGSSAFLAPVDPPAAAVDLDALDRLDVNELIALLRQCRTKEETFYVEQAINVNMHWNSERAARGKGQLAAPGDNGEEIREFDMLGTVIRYKVTRADRAVVNYIHEHIRMYVPGNTLIVSKSFADRHLTAKAISYAVEANDEYMWLVPGTGAAVVFELASLLDEERNESKMIMQLMRCCSDYVHELKLYQDEFVRKYREYLQRRF